MASTATTAETADKDTTNDQAAAPNTNPTDNAANNKEETPPPPPPQPTTPRSFFSRMSSLSSTAAPLLEQVYDRAHKRAVALKETAAAAQDAVKVIRITSAEVAKDLTPIDSGDAEDLSPKESSELSGRSSASFSSEESSLNDDAQTAASAENTNESTPTPTRFSSVVSAYTEFRTTGRYHRKSSSDGNEKSNWYDSPLIVGGADKVAGLGRLKLKNLVTMVGGEDNESQAEEVPAMPPRSPRPPKRTHSYYEEAVKNLLQPGQRALFFGRGTMGVILKPTYLASWRGKDGGGLVSSSKKGGVFIDALVPGGHAERSGVVFVGDYVLKIGNLDVRNYTLEELVAAIAEAERPNIMVLTGECEVVTQTVEDRDYFVSPLDLAFGYVNKIAAEGSDGRSNGTDKKGVAKPELRPDVSGNSLLDEDDGEDDEEVCFSSGSKDGELNNPVLDVSSENQNDYHDEEKKGDDMETYDYEEKKGDEMETSSDEAKPAPTTEVALIAGETPSVPTVSHSKSNEDFDTLVHYATRRTNRQEEAAQVQASKSHSSISTLLARAAFLNPIFRTTLHEAFKECCTDPRRANFLDHFFQHYSTRKEVEMAARNEQDNKKGHKNLEYQVNENDATSSKNQRKLLELYIDLLKFRSAARVEYFDKEKLLETARAISSLILVEDGDIARSDDALPESVVSVACGGIECLHHLKRALSDEDDFFDEVHGDGFCKIRDELGTFLSMQEHFLSFLVSDDCARMRAYLRGTTPFVNVEPDVLLETKTTNNILMFAILHLICMKESPDELESSDEYGDFIKMDAMLLNQRFGKRITGAASTLSCPIFIMHTLNGSLRQAMESLVEDEMMGQSNNLAYKKLADHVQHLWDHFVSPVTGALSSVNHSDETQAALDAVRCLLTSFYNEAVAQDGTVRTLGTVSWAKSFTSEGVSNALHVLSDSLLRDYCLVTFPNFRRSVFHEWMLTEASGCPAEDIRSSKINEYLVPRVFNGPSRCCSRKVLRQIELPHGLSLHLPGSVPVQEISETVTDKLYNADVAVVFGKEVDGDVALSPKSESSADTLSNDLSCQRYAISLLSTEHEASCGKFLTPSAIPDTFEEYVMQPPFCERPFAGMLRKEENNRMSIDGWEVSLTSSMIPVGKGSSDMLYCASLVFSNINVGAHASCWDINAVADLLVDELHYEPDACKVETDPTPPQCDKRQFKSPIFVVESDNGNIRKMSVPSDLKNFNQELKEQISTKQAYPKRMIGISIVSSRNVLPAMHHSLSLLYDDLCSVRAVSGARSHGARHHVCRPLLDLLSVFACPNVEDKALKCILEPYISHATSQWVDRPLSDQSEQLSKYCGTQLVQSLPPVPLALLFVTALLEQKIVFSSSRRSMLMSASVAITQLLRPLNWTHLIVPQTPISLVNDLIHYPAPFILGLSTDDKKSARILRSLPSDVTLVDLDVGRVMLASVFVYDNATNTSKSGMSESSQAAALRSQSLTLAEFLGGIFGSSIYQESWMCESPLQAFCSNEDDPPSSDASKFAAIQNICCDFLTELIFGISSCCLRIDDGSTSTTGESTTIIFDEDRFINNKISRARELREKASEKFFWSLHHFDIFLEAFLRTQSLSTLISSRDK